MKKWILILPIVLLALVACAPGAEPESEIRVVVASPEATNSPLREVATVLRATAVPIDELPVAPTAVPTNEPPTQPTFVPTGEPVNEPTAVLSPPTAVPETAVGAGRTDEGAFFLGAADAPVTMIDYSDFL